MDNQIKKPSSQDPVPKKPRISPIWWIALLVLIVWNIWALLPVTQREISIPYSEFLAQVAAGNVSSVQIVGAQITGTFSKQIPASALFPTPTALAPSTGSSNPLPEQAGLNQSYSEFSTTFPEAVGDTRLLPLLAAHNVTVDVQQPPSPWFQTLLINWLPVLLLVVLMVWMGRQASQSQAGIFNFGRSKARRYNEERPEVTFEDVAGAEEAKQELVEVVEFLRRPQKFHELGARIPRGVLLVGSPGTGKTLLARAVAGEAGVPFFSLSASEFVEMFVGVGASRVRDLFEQAKNAAPAIVFIDEMDAVGRRRGAGLGAVNDEREQTLNQLLVEMDGFDDRHEVIVLAATNRPDVLDPALLRPGRFDREITVGLPDRKGREGILRIHTRPLRLAPDVSLEILAKTTTGFSGADLANLCNEAALVAARENHDVVHNSDFEEALDRILLGAARTVLLSEKDRQVVAYHESGHALVAWLTPQADPVHKVTIIPRGRALGVTEQLPDDDHYNYSRENLLARLAVMLGGRAAEELAIGDVTTGAENDLMEATRLAHRMVTRWGMGNLGLMATSTNEEQPFLGYELSQGRTISEATAARVDQDIQELLEERHQVVKALLSGAREKLDWLVQVLLQEETIDQDELEKILGPRPTNTAEITAPILEAVNAS